MPKVTGPSSGGDGRQVHPPVATVERAVEYITNALTDSKLYMKEACKELGWSFPRIRSRALTIAKKMNCTFTKVTRGEYILTPINDTTETPAETPVEAINTEPSLDPDEVERALLGDPPLSEI